MYHIRYLRPCFLACCITAEALSLIGLGSFAAAAALLLGLLAYDAFWVFGTGALLGNGDMNANVMSTVAMSSSFQGPFRLLFPAYENVLDPRPFGASPWSLLGLGDVAVPGLLAALALRYDASRATDMGGRATAAAAAFMSTFEDAWEEADAAAEAKTPGSKADRLDERVAFTVADAMDAAFDNAADALGDTASDKSNIDGGDGGGGGMPSGAAATGGASIAAGGGGGGGGSGGVVNGMNMFIPRSMGGRAFFSSVMTGYVGGLLAAVVVNVVTKTGQPALVYLVPCTLGSIVYTAVQRGELDRLLAFKDAKTLKEEAEKALEESSKK